MLLKFQWFTFARLSRIFLGLFIVFFSFQIRTLVYGGTLYLSGNFNPYTTFFIYFADLFLLGAFLLWAVSMWRREGKSQFTFGNHIFALIFLLFLGALTLEVLFAQDKLLHLLNVFRFSELFLLYLMLVNRLLRPRTVIFCFLGAMALQAVIAIYQYILQSSLGLRILGEPLASVSTLGVAKIDLAGGKILRAFGTFAHANILGGAMLMALMLTFPYLRKQPWFSIPLILLLSVALLFSFSRSALFGFVAAGFVYFSVIEKKIPFQKIILALSLVLFAIVALGLEHIVWQRLLFEDVQSAQERTVYLDVSKSMILKEPLGVGIGGFTLQMQNYSDLKLAPWLFQPVHNAYFLIANEGGVLAGLLFLALLGYLFYLLVAAFSRSKNNEQKQYFAFYISLLTGIGIISVFDHYFFSLYQGQVLLFLFLGLASGLVEKSDIKEY